MAGKTPRTGAEIAETEALAHRMYLERGGDALDELIECDRVAVRMFRAQLECAEHEPIAMRTGVQMQALLGRHLAQRERMMRDCRKLAEEVCGARDAASKTQPPGVEGHERAVETPAAPAQLFEALAPSAAGPESADEAHVPSIEGLTASALQAAAGLLPDARTRHWQAPALAPNNHHGKPETRHQQT